MKGLNRKIAIDNITCQDCSRIIRMGVTMGTKFWTV